MFFEDPLYLHGLNLMPQFGPARLMQITKNFNTFQEAFLADKSSLTKLGMDEKIADEFIHLRQKINLKNEAEHLTKEQIKLLTFKDKNYPELLKQIPKNPPLLYFKGFMNSPEELCIAVVGTRKITNYGRTVTPQLVEPLVDAGAIIVSGMAFGVDSTAHEIAVKKNRRTIAVLGGGLDEQSLYPKHHALLAQQIIDAGGALLSEYPIGTPNFKQNFVARNRIISGLAVATLVVECDLKSGTLITANHALDQNRTVFAVPGPIYSPQSQGPNNLLKMGAKPATTAGDILDDLNLTSLPAQQETVASFGESKEEACLLKLINYEPIGVNELIKQCGLQPSEVITALTFLEMKGKIRNMGGQQYILSR